MSDTTTSNDCTTTCGCRATTPEAALAGALFATGRASNVDEATLSAKAIEWALREYGWKVSPVT